MGEPAGFFKLGTTLVLAAGAVFAMSLPSWAFVKGEVVANKVNIRTEASTDSEVLYMVDRGQAVNILDEEGDYYKVDLSLDRERYISKDYVQITEIVGVVTKDNTDLLDKPVSEGGVSMVEVNSTFAVNVQFYDDEGYYIDYQDRDYFIEKENLEVPDVVDIPEKGETTEVFFSEAPVPAGDFQSTGNTLDDVVAYAKEFQGIRYRYGSSSPSNGFDCSGFVTYVLKNFGVSVSRSSASMAQNGVSVGRDELQKGDLLFFATTNGSSRISHVGMYIGDGQFIHSSTWGEGVVVTGLDEDYYRRCFVKARRVL